MLYEIKVNHDDESWEVIAKHSIESEEGAEDELVAVFYNKEQLKSFKKTLNIQDAIIQDAIIEELKPRRFTVNVLDNEKGTEFEHSVDGFKFMGIIESEQVSFSIDSIYKQEQDLLKKFEEEGHFEKTLPRSGKYLYMIGKTYLPNV